MGGQGRNVNDLYSLDVIGRTNVNLQPFHLVEFRVVVNKIIFCRLNSINGNAGGKVARTVGARSSSSPVRVSADSKSFLKKILSSNRLKVFSLPFTKIQNSLGFILRLARQSSLCRWAWGMLNGLEKVMGAGVFIYAQSGIVPHPGTIHCDVDLKNKQFL